ncbi:MULTISPECIES: RHS repeat domain-containing protein [unclassified Pseudomonas]|uniref:RHS repeat domain-containing protein n=1 Tax=unclassified Pseudomonas TaxID=196821 RepID=UPI001FAE9C21|nr:MULTISPECIES: RHS repeat domain-containing protein [unclassified Pseudomonas]
MPVQVTDGAGSTRRYGYDAHGNLNTAASCWAKWTFKRRADLCRLDMKRDRSSPRCCSAMKGGRQPCFIP